MITAINNLLLALYEIARWRRVVAEIEARRLAITEMERIEDETDKLQKQLEELRRRGDNRGADAVVRRLSQRTIFSAGISNLVAGPDLHGPDERDLGQPAGGPGKGPADPAAAGNHPQDPGA